MACPDGCLCDPCCKRARLDSPQYGQQYGRFGLGYGNNGLGDVQAKDPYKGMGERVEGRSTKALRSRSWQSACEDVSAGVALRFYLLGPA